MMGLGWQELAIVLVIIVIIFGAGKLPEVLKSLGQGVKEFKQEAVAPVASADTSTTPTMATVGSDTNGVIGAASASVDSTAEIERAKASRGEGAARSTI